jgi:hypothetical protein
MGQDCCNCGRAVESRPDTYRMEHRHMGTSRKECLPVVMTAAVITNTGLRESYYKELKK